MASPHPHTGQHLTSSAILQDIVIGLSDGLTVPFALAAGLSGAVTPSSLVIIVGLAEVVADSIAMGLGGYLAGPHGSGALYTAELTREHREVRELTADPEQWVKFMMKYELGLEEPDARQAPKSAAPLPLPAHMPWVVLFP